MARRQYAIPMQQQDRDADEFLDLGQRVFVLVVVAALRRRLRQTRQIVQCFLR